MTYEPGSGAPHKFRFNEFFNRSMALAPANRSVPVGHCAALPAARSRRVVWLVLPTGSKRWASRSAWQNPYLTHWCLETFVAMMQAAALRYGDHLSDPAWHGRARVGAILVERQMRAGALVIVDVSVQIVAGY